jgi:hypothetical protein
MTTFHKAGMDRHIHLTLHDEPFCSRPNLPTLKCQQERTAQGMDSGCSCTCSVPSLTLTLINVRMRFTYHVPYLLTHASHDLPL